MGGCYRSLIRVARLRAVSNEVGCDRMRLLGRGS